MIGSNLIVIIVLMIHLFNRIIIYRLFKLLLKLLLLLKYNELDQAYKLNNNK